MRTRELIPSRRGHADPRQVVANVSPVLRRCGSVLSYRNATMKFVKMDTFRRGDETTGPPARREAGSPRVERAGDRVAARREMSSHRRMPAPGYLHGRDIVTTTGLSGTAQQWYGAGWAARLARQRTDRAACTSRVRR